MMTQRNERDLVHARKAFYDRANVEKNLLKKGEFAGNINTDQQNCVKI